MKTIKTFDYIIQAILIIAAVFMNVALGFDIDKGATLPFYFIVGGWQVLSVLTHLFIRDVPKHRLRKVYHVLLIITIVLGILLMFGDSIIFYLAALLFWSPVLAVLYLVCCYLETQSISPAGVEAGQIK